MSQLSQIFTNIANAIRGKTGSNELITPPEMATAIDNIPSGGANVYTFYYWSNGDSGYFTLSENPQVDDNAYYEDDSSSVDRYTEPKKIISVSDTSINLGDGPIARDENGDIIFTKS